MGNLRHTTNELLVGLFNYILYIEDRNLKKRGITLSMNDVHILENKRQQHVSYCRKTDGHTGDTDDQCDKADR